MDEQNWMEKIGVLKDLGDIKIALTRIEGDLRSHRDTVQIHNDIVESKLKEHGHTLYGEGGQPGLVTITDRLKERMDTWGWNFAMIWAAIVSIGVEIIISRVVRHN